MADQSIFESEAADAGVNIPVPPGDRAKAIAWLIARLSKLTNERRATANLICEVRKAAKNDGYAAKTISTAKALARMTPERRNEYSKQMTKALSLFGLEISTLSEDPKPDALFNQHLLKLRSLESDRRDISIEIVETFKAAKDSEIDVRALKEILRVTRLDPEDREEYFHRLDNLGTIMGYW